MRATGIVQYRITIKPTTTMPSNLHRLVQQLRAIQVTRGQIPWRYLDLTMAQLKAVMLLCRTGRAKGRELADGLGIAPSAATPLVDRLVEQKLATREDDPTDRRIVWILPTKKAQAIYDQLMDTSRDVLDDVINEVPARQRKTVRDSVQLLADAAARVLARDRDSTPLSRARSAKARR